MYQQKFSDRLMGIFIEYRANSLKVVFLCHDPVKGIPFEIWTWKLRKSFYLYSYKHSAWGIPIDAVFGSSHGNVYQRIPIDIF